MPDAVAQVDAWMSSPTVTLLGETGSHWELLKANLVEGKVSGPMVHDARIAAICEGHGVTSFLSADRDFSRFPRLPTYNPLLG